jgi:hypothetical protein
MTSTYRNREIIERTTSRQINLHATGSHTFRLDLDLINRLHYLGLISVTASYQLEADNRPQQWLEMHIFFSSVCKRGLLQQIMQNSPLRLRI